MGKEHITLHQGDKIIFVLAYLDDTNSHKPSLSTPVYKKKLMKYDATLGVQR